MIISLIVFFPSLESLSLLYLPFFSSFLLHLVYFEYSQVFCLHATVFRNHLNMVFKTTVLWPTSCVLYLLLNKNLGLRILYFIYWPSEGKLLS